MNKFLQLFFTLFISQTVASQVHLDTVSVVPKTLKEISGMTITPAGNIWAINDSGNEPILYQLDKNGQIKHACTIEHAKNVDWEELTHDNNGNIYIGDFGNNRNNRDNLRIYIVQENVALYSPTAVASRIEFAYPDQTAFPALVKDQNFDMEAMVFLNNHLYLFSKNRTVPFTGYTNMYKLPTRPGKYMAEKLDSLYLGKGPKELYQVTSAAISPSGSNLALMSYDKCFILFDFSKTDFFGGRLKQINFAEVSQKETVVWQGDSTLLISDEKSVLGGGFIYNLSLKDEILENNKIRKDEVQIPVQEFQDTLDVYVNTEVRGSIYYEFFSGEGKRVEASKIGDFERGKHTIKLAPSEFPNGAYLLNIRVGNRPHGFFVYRHNPVDWQKVEADFNKRRKEAEKKYSENNTTIGN